MTPADIMGTWLLTGCTRFTEGQPADHPLGPRPTGLILYAPDGFMSAFIHKDAALTWDGPLLASYSGRWTMSGNIIRHQIMFNSDPERANVEVVRAPRMEGASLVLQTERKPGKRGVSWMDFAWKRP